MCIFAMINLLIYCCVILLVSRIELVNTTDNIYIYKFNGLKFEVPSTKLGKHVLLTQL